MGLKLLFSSLGGDTVLTKDIGEGICDNRFSEAEEVIFLKEVSARLRKYKLRMHNLHGKYPHVIENVDCRCKIYIGSILTSQKRQDVDAIMRSRQVEKHLQVQQKTSCRYLVLKKSICNCEYQGNADTSVVKKASATANILDM